MLKTLLLGRSDDSKPLTTWRKFYLFMLYVALPLGVFHWWIKSMVAVFALAMLGQFMDGETEVHFDKAFYTWGGDIGIEGLRITPGDTSIPPVTARRAVLHTPGWLWTLDLLNLPDEGHRSNLTRSGRRANAARAVVELVAGEKEPEPLIPHSDALSLDVEELHVGFADFLPASIDSFGWTSAAPFESAGCRGDGYWSEAEIGQMGLSSPGSHFRWSFETIDLVQARTAVALETPGIGRVEVEETWHSTPSNAYLTNDEENDKLIEQKYLFHDDGFIAARNQFCAKRDRVAQRDFLARHLAAVKRQLEADGLAPSPAVEALYARYAEKGGELLIDAKPSQEIAFEQYGAYDGAAQARLYNAKIELRGQGPAIALDMLATPKRPIPEDYAGSTWDLIASEQGLAEGAGQRAAGNVASPSHVRPRLGEAAAPVAVSSAATSSTSTPATLSAAGPSSAAGAPADDEGFAQSAADRKPVLHYDDLANLVGRAVRLQLETTQRVGTIMSFSKQAVVIRVRMQSGTATLTIGREHVLGIEPL